MDDIIAIKNYILFLKKECNLDITLHPWGDEQLITLSELILFNIHENAQCAAEIFIMPFLLSLG